MLEAAFTQIPEEVAATVKPATILNINPERGSDKGQLDVPVLCLSFPLEAVGSTSPNPYDISPRAGTRATGDSRLRGMSNRTRRHSHVGLAQEGHSCPFTRGEVPAVVAAAPPPPRRRRNEARADKHTRSDKDRRAKKAEARSDETTIKSEAWPEEATVEAWADETAIEAPLESPTVESAPTTMGRGRSQPRAAIKAIATRATRNGEDMGCLLFIQPTLHLRPPVNRADMTTRPRPPISWGGSTASATCRCSARATTPCVSLSPRGGELPKAFPTTLTVLLSC